MSMRTTSTPGPKRSRDENSSRSSITVISYSSCAAILASASPTWPPPATTRRGLATTGSTRSSCVSSRTTVRALPRRRASSEASRACPSRTGSPSEPCAAPSVSTKTFPPGRTSLPSLSSSVAKATGLPPDDAASTSPKRSRPPRRSARSPGSIEIHIVPPHTRPVSHARSSVSSYSRSESSPLVITVFASSNASPSTHPPPSVPVRRPRSSTSSFAPTTCGVLPTVRTTVQTAKRRPSRSSSAMRV